MGRAAGGNGEGDDGSGCDGEEAAGRSGGPRAAASGERPADHGISGGGGVVTSLGGAKLDRGGFSGRLGTGMEKGGDNGIGLRLVVEMGRERWHSGREAVNREERSGGTAVARHFGTERGRRVDARGGGTTAAMGRRWRQAMVTAMVDYGGWLVRRR